MVRQQSMQFFAARDRVTRKISLGAQLFKMLARTADPRAFKVVDVEVSQQMHPRRQADDFDLSPAIVGDKGLFAGCNQKVEGVVIAPALAGYKKRGLGSRRLTQC